MSILYVIDVNIVAIFYIIVDDANIWQRSDFVRGNDETSVINMNEIDNYVRFNTLESTIEISNVIAWWGHEFPWIVTAHGNNNLFVRWALGHYIDFGLQFIAIIENWFVEFFDLLVGELREIFLNFENVVYVLRQDLCIWWFCSISSIS